MKTRTWSKGKGFLSDEDVQDLEDSRERYEFDGKKYVRKRSQEEIDSIKKKRLNEKKPIKSLDELKKRAKDFTE